MRRGHCFALRRLRKRQAQLLGERAFTLAQNLAQSRLPCELMRGSPITRSYEDRP